MTSLLATLRKDLPQRQPESDELAAAIIDGTVGRMARGAGPYPALVQSVRDGLARQLKGTERLSTEAEKFRSEVMTTVDEFFAACRTPRSKLVDDAVDKRFLRICNIALKSICHGGNPRDAVDGAVVEVLGNFGSPTFSWKVKVEEPRPPREERIERLEYRRVRSNRSAGFGKSAHLAKPTSRP